MNDEDREQWIDNDEGLYRWWRSSRQPNGKRMSKRQFVKENRQELTEAINNMLNNTKPAHYLRYGG